VAVWCCRIPTRLQWCHLESAPLRFSELFVDVLQARDLAPPFSAAGALLPYAVVTCQSSRGQTDPDEDNPNEPQWLTNFVLAVDHDLAIRASSRPVPSSTTDLTATHVAVSVLSRRNGAVSADDDELIGSVLIPLADLHAQLPVVAWYPLHARPAKAEAQRVGSPKSGGIKSRQVGLVQLALHWVHALGELAHALQKRSIADLQSLFSAVDVSQLFLRVHSADLSAAWPSHADVAEHAAWLAPAVTLQFQGHTLRTEEGQAAANSGADPATMSRTHPCFDGRTYSFDVDSGGDLALQFSVRRSLRASTGSWTRP